MKEIMFGEEKITVLEASGYDDGYYWDMNATIMYDGDCYHLFNFGSGSRYIPCCSGIKKGTFDRLYGEEQISIDDDDNLWESIEAMIIELLDNFIHSGAESSWESQENDDWSCGTDILIDGEKVNEE